MMSSMVSSIVSTIVSTKPRSTHTSMMPMMPMATTHSHTKPTTTMMLMMMMSSTKPSRPGVKASSHANTRTKFVSSRRWISASAHSHTGVHMMMAITAAVEGEAGAHVVPCL
ncbi:hypothetical protein BDV24DRAFT_126436 [Aspergillus arachidicola]|uniref:Uncharacterized protein n=1 Tax=Aspergillus arachidicola TaxID=656916 RepID=A0A5N6YHQ6_9EURO|nr:hypothetical protein BDV24DRAFT_126436 [Aspergillus arachidicola]